MLKIKQKRPEVELYYYSPQILFLIILLNIKSKCSAVFTEKKRITCLLFTQTVSNFNWNITHRFIRNTKQLPCIWISNQTNLPSLSLVRPFTNDRQHNVHVLQQSQ